MPTATGDRLALAALGALAAALVLAPAPASAQARVVAALDRDEIAIDESVTLTVQIESQDAPDGIEFPKDLPFTVLSRNQQSGSSFSLGGGAGVRITRSLTLRIELAPKTTGDLAIPPITAVVGGKRFSSKALTLKVLPEGSRPKPPPALPAPPPGAFSPFGSPFPRGGSNWRGWERDLSMVLDLDRSEVFVGEPVVATLWIYSPVGIVSLETYQPPAFDGLWVEEFEQKPFAPQTRVVDGVPLRAYLFKRFALFPTRAGALEIGPFTVKLQVRVGTDSPFDPFPEIRGARRKSAPVTVTVKPLPAGAPPGFASVNVGRLSLEAGASETTVPAGQPVTIRVTARGDGNVRTLSLPAIPGLPGVRRFDPTSTDKVSNKGARLTGTRTVETVLVPEREGELVIPALAWPVFDPSKGAYETLRTAPIRVLVTRSETAAGAAPIAGANALTAGLRPIRSGGPLAPAAPPPWRGPLFLAVIAAPVLGFAGLGLALRWRERQASTAGARRTRSAGRTARRRLRAARRALARGEREPFLAEVERALAGYCADRLGAPVGSLTRDALGDALRRAGAHGPSVRALEEALVACDAARYGRGAAGADEALLASAERALSLLDEADWSSGEAA